MPNSKVAPPQPPSFWSQVPRAVWRKLELSTVLRDALIATRQRSVYGPVIALNSLESYVTAAMRQQARVKRAMSAPLARVDGRRSSLFDDTHFYLIAWARIDKLGSYLASETRYPRVRQVLRRYRADLEKRVLARNHLEHFEKRLPGALEEKKLASPNDLFNMANNSMTYGGMSVDIGPNSLTLLIDLWTELRAALLYDAVEALAGADLESLRRLLHRAASDLHLARLTKQTMKMLKLDSTTS